MVKMGMKDQKFSDSGLIDMKFLELFQDIRDKVTQTSADKHGFIPSLQKVDARFFRTQKP